MQKPERSTYSPLDFLEWEQTDILVLSPKFQRREVWSTPKRSYLIDTLIQGMPVPPLYLRVRQSDDRRKLIREVVDGQQRIRACIDYLRGEYALSKTLEAPYRGKRFDQLSQDQQDAITNYSFICEVFRGVSDADILQVFRRLNTYSVPLNDQELRNGTFFGLFKQTVYRLASSRLEYWRNNKILTDQNIARMGEAELVSELLVAQLHGMQDKKKKLSHYYKLYDAEFPARDAAEARFHAVMDEIAELGPLSDTAFTRVPLFYSLYCVVYHRLYSMPEQAGATGGRGQLTVLERQLLRDAIFLLSDLVRDADDIDALTPDDARFVAACSQQTDNIRPRQERFDAIFRVAFEG